MLELYHWEPNGLFLKPLIALEENRRAFRRAAGSIRRASSRSPTDFRPASNRGSRSSAKVRCWSPTATVISSTFFMLEYIAEALPGPALMPRGAYHRYRARAWGQFLGLSLGSMTSALGCARYLAPELARRDAADSGQIDRIEPVERRTAWLAVIDGVVRRDRAGRTAPAPVDSHRTPRGRARAGPWLAGPDYSIADIDAYALVDPLRDLAPEVVNAGRLLGSWPGWPDRRAPCGARGARPVAQRAPEQAFVPGVEAARWG